MPKEITLKEAYGSCSAEGNFIYNLECDTDRVKAMLMIAEEQWTAAKSLTSKKLWNSTYKMYYDVLHLLVEGFLLLDRVKSRNHLCLFAYLCEKHPSLELDWNFFERIRTKRNGLMYYGSPVDGRDWKEVGLQFELYIKLLVEKISSKL